MHCTKISPEFECQDQRSKVTGDKKKRKSAAFCSGVVLWGAVLVRRDPRGLCVRYMFAKVSTGVAQQSNVYVFSGVCHLYAGGKISACCLVSFLNYSDDRTCVVILVIWPYCVRWGPSSPSIPQRSTARHFRPIYVAAKWLHGSRCHLVWR